MKGNKPSKKKVSFHVQKELNLYLDAYNRNIKLPLQYEDLLRFTTAVPLMDNDDNDTFWETVYFCESDTRELHKAMQEIYALLKTDGDTNVMEHLSVARIDYCTFGNSKPFRVRIINRFNDNYDHFYVKRADASRIYGLELEYLLSPNAIQYFVDGETLIEEHVAGIPGDDFMKNNMNESLFNKTRIAKEFIKFNERCFVRLLGDMRSYNFVVDITPDIEGSQYRIRAIDFDQQSYEGKFNIYRPQFFKENLKMVELVSETFQKLSIDQYKIEERSILVKRLKSYSVRIQKLLDSMAVDNISKDENVNLLKQTIYGYTKDKQFKKCKNMGEILKNALIFLNQNYEDVKPKKFY